MERNRASGWKYAKLSGHENEADVERLFDDEDFCLAFSKRLGLPAIKSARVGGLCETDVPSVFLDKTKSKTDLQLILENGKTVNISIKKSWGGQVYLIGADRFIAGYEIQFNETISDEVKDLIYLYFYGNPKTDLLLHDPAVVKGQETKLIDYQLKHNRLVWDSLYNMDSAAADMLLNWFKENIDNIAEYCFSRGLAKNSKDWADYVWYINLLGEDDIDEIFSIDDIKSAVAEHRDLIYPSSQNGGSTTQLPFGFVQWHQCKMQFHHSLEKLSSILTSL